MPLPAKTPFDTVFDAAFVTQAIRQINAARQGHRDLRERVPHCDDLRVWLLDCAPSPLHEEVFFFLAQVDAPRATSGHVLLQCRNPGPLLAAPELWQHNLPFEAAVSVAEQITILRDRDTPPCLVVDCAASAFSPGIEPGVFLSEGCLPPPHLLHNLGFELFHAHGFVNVSLLARSRHDDLIVYTGRVADGRIGAPEVTMPVPASEDPFRHVPGWWPPDAQGREQLPPGEAWAVVHDRRYNNGNRMALRVTQVMPRVCFGF